MHMHTVHTPDRLSSCQGADPWLVDRCGGKTALHHAAIAGSGPCIKALMEGLADSHRVVGGVR